MVDFVPLQGRKGLVLFRNPLRVVSLLAERWKRERDVRNRLNFSFELALDWDGWDCPVIPLSIKASFISVEL